MAQHGDGATYEPPTVESLGTLEELTRITPKGTTNVPDAYGHHAIIVSP